MEIHCQLIDREINDVYISGAAHDCVERCLLRDLLAEEVGCARHIDSFQLLAGDKDSDKLVDKSCNTGISYHSSFSFPPGDLEHTVLHLYIKMA